MVIYTDTLLTTYTTLFLLKVGMLCDYLLILLTDAYIRTATKNL